MDETALSGLLAKQEIGEVVLRYCRGVDRLDMDLVRGAYHPGGIDHHTGFDGPVEDFVAWVEPLLRTLGGTRHEVHNHLAEVVGDTAVAETYVTARHWTMPDAQLGRGAERANFTTGVRYVDHLERRGGRWGIVERFAIREWHRVDAAPTAGQGLPGPSGTRDRDDAVYALRRRLFALP
ncbi:nuclear transport factor 2 family protein [Tomitella biformata]|uniref:nuclear transport factor 2 family protein n=1 Tax=Tomitella biformata TaxID=630403 RepID=UPI000466643A|nr:nuclear transport factor 2 family protein [Tomitella biformata]